MLLDHRFCLTTLVASNHEPGVTLRAIANNGWQTRTLEPVGRTSRVCDPGQSLRPGGIDPACRLLAHGQSSLGGTQFHVPGSQAREPPVRRPSQRHARPPTLSLAAQGCFEATKRAGKKHWQVALRKHITGNFLISYNNMEGTSRRQRRNRTWHGVHLRSVPRRDKLEDPFDRSALPTRCARTTRPSGVTPFRR